MKDPDLNFAEQKRLAKAVAIADEVPELVSELRKRSARIRHLEAQIISAGQSGARESDRTWPMFTYMRTGVIASIAATP